MGTDAAGLEAVFVTSPDYFAVRLMRMTKEVEGEPTPQTMRRLVKGVELEDGVAHAVSAQSLGEMDDGYFQVRLSMREGSEYQIETLTDSNVSSRVAAEAPSGPESSRRLDSSFG